MNLLRDESTWRCRIMKQFVDQFYRTILVRSPSAIKIRASWKIDSAAHDKSTPLIPVAFHSSVRMIAINQQQVDRILPIANRLIAKFLDPR
jgi:hypothetical protein